eukprot:5599-Amorphochlora_amoeboformis.AAC.1
MLTWRRVLGLALPFRGFSSRPTAWEMHDKAVKEGMNFYTDPETGFLPSRPFSIPPPYLNSSCRIGEGYPDV